MAIAYKSAGAGVSNATTAAVSPACPATVDAGDVLITHVFYRGTAEGPTTPSGWTLLSGPHVIETTVARHWAFGKIADGTEDGATVSHGTSGASVEKGARIYSFSGRVSGTITELVTGFAATSHATDPQMPTVVTTTSGNLAVTLVTQSDNNALAAATGESGGDWTEAVAEYAAALNTGLVLQLQTATPTADPGTISGGAVAATDDPSGVVGFQIKHTGATAHTQPVPDTIAGVDVLGKGAGKAQADAAAGTDARIAVAGKVQADVGAGTDASARSVGKAVADSVAGADAQSSVWTIARAVDEALAGTDTAAKAITHSVADVAALGDSQALQSGATLAVEDTLAGADATAAAVAHPLADAGLLEDASDPQLTSGGDALALQLDDVVQATDAQTKAAGSIVADTAAGADAVGKSAAFNLADALAVADAVAREWDALRVVSDGGNWTDAAQTQSTGPLDWTHAVDDSIAGSDAHVAGFVRTLADTVAVTDTAVRGVEVRQADALTGMDALAREWAATRVLADALAGTDEIKLAVNAWVVTPELSWALTAQTRWPDDDDTRWPPDTDAAWASTTEGNW